MDALRQQYASMLGLYLDNVMHRSIDAAGRNGRSFDEIMEEEAQKLLLQPENRETLRMFIENQDHPIFQFYSPTVRRVLAKVNAGERETSEAAKGPN